MENLAKEVVKCLMCGKKFRDYVSKNRKYCSRECRNRHLILQWKIYQINKSSQIAGIKTSIGGVRANAQQ